MKKRVIGLGGIFFKSENPDKTKEWYAKHLGVESDQYGGKFVWRSAEGGDEQKITVWSPFPKDTDYYQPSKKDFMFNYRVEDLEELLKVLKEEGVEQIGEMEVYEYGKFAWIMDPDGTKVELWEPEDSSLITPPMNKSE